MSAKVKLKLITITEAERSEDSRLFVLNRTADPVGNINITATMEDGSRGCVVIPSTFIPFDMSNYISKKSLLAASEFRRLVARAMVYLVDPDEAANFIENSDRAKREQARLLSSLGGADVSDDKQFIEIQDNIREEIKVEQTLEADPFVMAIIDRENSEDAGDLLNELEARAYTLKRTDLEYLMANTKQPTIKTWAADTIQIID